MHVVVTGGAGFIGSSLVDGLLSKGHRVTAIDNLSTGKRNFIESAEKHSDFELLTLDLYEDGSLLSGAISGADAVFHLAANADVRFGWNVPDRDLKQNVIATHNVLEAMRLAGVGRILFSSTGSIYGDAPVIPTPEDCPFPVQTSLYGASKLAAEGLIAAYAEGCNISATVFRFVSVLGPRYTHGHVVDFLGQLLRDPSGLKVLGDGSQRKSYMDISDCVEAMARMLDLDHKYEVYNLGVDGYCTVNESIEWICSRLSVHPEVHYTGGSRGWVGDNPFIYLDTTKIRSEGWSPHYSIRESVERTVDYLLDNTWIIEKSKVRA